jgi:hypothetical protein
MINRNGREMFHRDEGGNLILDEEGNTIPRLNLRYQSFEFLWCNKAMKLLIPMNVTTDRQDRRVYSSETSK